MGGYLGGMISHPGGYGYAQPVVMNGGGVVGAPIVDGGAVVAQPAGGMYMLGQVITFFLSILMLIFMGWIVMKFINWITE